MAKRMKAAVLHVRLLQKRVESAPESALYQGAPVVVCNVAVVSLWLLRKHLAQDLKGRVGRRDDRH